MAKKIRFHKAAWLALSLILGTSPAVLAAPTGMNVVVGAVTADQASTATNLVLNIAGKGAIINWNSFSLANNESAIFNMNANAAVLNRVTGGNLSTIAGTISSPGKIFLVNPSGMVFANGAIINTGLFLATTHDVTNANFADYMNGNTSQLLFNGATATANNSGIAINGSTTIQGSGNFVLLGNTVTLAPGVTLTTLTGPNAGNSSIQSPTFGPINVVAAASATFNDSVNATNPIIEFQATPSNFLTIGSSTAGSKIQATGIMLGAGAINITGASGPGNGSWIHNNGGNALLFAANTYSYPDRQITGTPSNTITITNSRVGFKSGEIENMTQDGSGITILGGSIGINNAAIYTPSNTIAMAAASSASINTNEILRQTVVNSTSGTGNSIVTSDIDNNNTMSANNISGRGIYMFASNYDLKNTTIYSPMDSIELFAGSNLAATFKMDPNADYREQVQGIATSANSINLSLTKINADASGTSIMDTVTLLGGQVNINNGSQVIADNYRFDHQGNVTLMGYTNVDYKRANVGNNYNGTLGSGIGASVNINNSQVTSGQIVIQGNTITNSGTIHGEYTDNVQLQAITSDDFGPGTLEVSTYTPSNTITNATAGRILNDAGDITMIGNTVNNAGSIAATLGNVTTGALDKVTNSGSITGNSISSISGSDYTTKTTVIIDDHSTVGMGSQIPHQSEVIIDPTNTPLTTATRILQTNDKTVLVVSGYPSGQALAQSAAATIDQNSSAADVNAAIDVAAQTGNKAVQTQVLTTVFNNIRGQSSAAIDSAAQHVMQTVSEDSKRDVSQAIIDGSQGRGTFNQTVTESNTVLVRSNKSVTSQVSPVTPVSTPVTPASAPTISVTTVAPASAPVLPIAPNAPSAPAATPQPSASQPAPQTPNAPAAPQASGSSQSSPLAAAPSQAASGQQSGSQDQSEQ